MKNSMSLSHNAPRSPGSNSVNAREDLPSLLASRLRDEITSGELKPGDRIYEAKIAREWDCKRGPVREAARLLQKEGLIVLQPNRGFAVKDITVKTLVKLSQFRTCIEAFSFRIAAQSSTIDELLLNLSQTLKEFKKRCLSGDRLGQVTLDLQFHRQIVDHCSNDYLSATFQHISSELMIAMRLMNLSTSNPTDLIRSHQYLIDKLSLKDPDVAEQAIQQHIQISWDETIKELSKKMDYSLVSLSAS